MTEKKYVYETAMMALPPLRMVLGEVPSPEPKLRIPGQQQQQSRREKREIITRLISYLKEEDC